MKVSKVGLENIYQINQVKNKTADEKQAKNVQQEKKIKEEISLSIKDEIKRYKEIIKDIPDIREGRVKEIRELISQGKYNINTKEVGNRILEDIILGAK